MNDNVQERSPDDFTRAGHLRRRTLEAIQKAGKQIDPAQGDKSMPNSNRRPEAIQKAGPGVGGAPEERLTEVPGIGLDTRIQESGGVRKAENVRPGMVVCPKCCHRAIWLRGYSGDSCCPRCKHRGKIFDELPLEWSGEPFVLIGKMLLIALAVFLFLVLPILLWQESDRMIREAGYREDENGVLMKR